MGDGGPCGKGKGKRSVGEGRRLGLGKRGKEGGVWGGGGGRGWEVLGIWKL